MIGRFLQLTASLFSDHAGMDINIVLSLLSFAKLSIRVMDKQLEVAKPFILFIEKVNWIKKEN